MVAVFAALAPRAEASVWYPFLTTAYAPGISVASDDHRPGFSQLLTLESGITAGRSVKEKTIEPSVVLMQAYNEFKQKRDGTNVDGALDTDLAMMAAVAYRLPLDETSLVLIKAALGRAHSTYKGNGARGLEIHSDGDFWGSASQVGATLRLGVLGAKLSFDFGVQATRIDAGKASVFKVTKIFEDDRKTGREYLRVASATIQVGLTYTFGRQEDPDETPLGPLD